MKTNPTTLDSPMVRIVAPTAALATGLLSPMARAAPGDLDPAFGDVGRVHSLPELTGQAWALDAEQDGDVLFGGFEETYCGYYYYYCDFTGYAGRLTGGGQLDPAFAAARLDATQILDVAVLADGKAVAVGSRRVSGREVLIVARLHPDGSLDERFGGDGIVELGDATGPSYRGRTLLVESDGRMVVSGTRGNAVILVRLQPDGTFDSSFGNAGVFEGPAVAAGSTSRVVRASGGYRMTAHVEVPVPGGTYSVQCRVVGVTDGGALDVSFGASGQSGSVGGGQENDQCASMAIQSSGRLVLAGSRIGFGEETAFATRLLPNGAPDPSFTDAAVTGAMQRVTALAVDREDAIVVAGHDKNGLSGALVVRLQADGLLDSLFGTAGSLSLEMPSFGDPWLNVHDIEILPDRGVLLSGGEFHGFPPQPFMVRLLGDGAGGGPGVLDVKTLAVPAIERTGQAVVTVRRIGGSTGPVSVAYETQVDPESSPAATPGLDYTAVSGRLQWADGDSSEKSIVVPLATGEAVAEFEEHFAVMLGAPEGGAGLGKRKARVTIYGDAYPAGRFSITASNPVVTEGLVSVRLAVRRLDYFEGAVSVTVRPTSGSATAGADFAATPVTLNWEDHDDSTRFAAIQINADKLRESSETFTVSLADPSGGATIGSDSSVEITITDATGSGKSGGGRTGGLVTLLLGLAGTLRRLRGVVFGAAHGVDSAMVEERSFMMQKGRGKIHKILI